MLQQRRGAGLGSGYAVRRSLLALAVLALALLALDPLALGSSVARAQDTPTAATSDSLSESDRAEARALFAAGAAAIDAGRWTDAVSSFRRAYELTHVPSALFNAAFALRALGRYREAVRDFDELLGLERTSDDMRAQATELRDDARAHLAIVRLVGLDDEARHLVRVDGEALEDTGDRPLVVTLDPGRHVLDAVRDGHERWEWTGTLENGAMLDLAVELVPEVVVLGASAVEPAPASRSVAEEPWLWIVVGLVVAGGAAFAGWYADDQAQLRPESGQVVRF